MAINNGIAKYVVVDARNSNAEWMRESLVSSFNAFQTGNVDWVQCEIEASSSLLIPICKYFEKHKGQQTLTSRDIASYFNISRDSVVRYLRKGSAIGLCSYDGSEAMRQAARIGGAAHKKQVAVYSMDGNHVATFSSGRELERLSKTIFGVQFKYQSISNVCTGRQKTHRGYIMKYVDARVDDAA